MSIVYIYIYMQIDTYRCIYIYIYNLNGYKYCCVQRVFLQADWKAMQESMNTWQVMQTLAT